MGLFLSVPRKVLRLFDERNEEGENTDEEPLYVDGDVDDVLLPSPKREGGRLLPTSDDNLAHPTPYVQNISRSAVDGKFRIFFKCIDVVLNLLYVHNHRGCLNFLEFE